MRNSNRINMLELEIYKLRIELDLMHEVLNNFLLESKQQLDSGKWYPRRMPPQQ